MKEDYKEEANKELRKFQDSQPYYGYCTQEYLEGIEEGFNHALKFTEDKQTRYHPDTLEPVEKPVEPEEPYLSDTECDVHIQWQIYLDNWNNALTLEQVFERYKEVVRLANAPIEDSDIGRGLVEMFKK